MYGTRDAGFFGYSHFTGGFPGGQAEYVRVPIGEVNLLPIPEEVPDEDALYLSDVLPTSYHCVVDTGVQEGDTVGIWVCSIYLHRQASRLNSSRALVPLDNAVFAGQN
jgi:threonine dehydrogenase-like Zn-dependent dehydrogenase